VGAPLLVSRTRPETDAERRNGNHHLERTFGEACQANPQDPLGDFRPLWFGVTCNNGA
jgi:hypothetical protein